MTRREKARRIAGILDELYPSVDVPLKHEDPFTLLVAVVLSAQTTDKLVNTVTPVLLGRWPEHPVLNVTVLLAYGVGGFLVALTLFRRRLMS